MAHAVIVKGLLFATTDKRTRTGILSIVAALLLPLFLVIMCFISFGSGGEQHNRAAVQLAFEGGENPANMPIDYGEYIEEMQESFAIIDDRISPIDEMTEGDLLDRYWVKAVFFSLYFGAGKVRLDADDYQAFVNCFVDYEERTRTEIDKNGKEVKEIYTVAVTVQDKVKIFNRIQTDFGKSASYEQQSNAVNVWYLAKYGVTAPEEGDTFSDWTNWVAVEEVPCYNLPASEVGSKVVELAMDRLGHPYSQEYRGTGNYVDCSYLTLWCYGQVGITLPGTAAEQGRYVVENNRTIAYEDLLPGDLVFGSYKPNGRFMNITHVGIYAGDGMVVDASSSKGKVVYRTIFDRNKQVLYGRPE